MKNNQKIKFGVTGEDQEPSGNDANICDFEQLKYIPIKTELYTKSGNDKIFTKNTDEGCQDLDILNRNVNFTKGQSSKSYSGFNMAFGKNCYAGTHYFNFLSGDLGGKTFDLIGDATAIATDTKYSAQISQNYNSIGKVTGVGTFNPETNTTRISVDVMPVPNIATNPYDNELSIIQTEGQPSISVVYCAARKDEIGANLIWFDGKPEYGNQQEDDCAVCFGRDNYAQKHYSLAHGRYCKAIGKYSHAEGWNTIAGYACHAEGNNTIAGIYGGEDSWNPAHAEGSNTQALNSTTHSDGNNCRALDSNSYVWSSGTKSVQNEPFYPSHGNGSYNINPLKGTNGFWINQMPLARHFSANVDSIFMNSRIIELFDKMNLTTATKLDKDTATKKENQAFEFNGSRDGEFEKLMRNVSGYILYVFDVNPFEFYRMKFSWWNQFAILDENDKLIIGYHTNNSIKTSTASNVLFAESDKQNYMYIPSQGRKLAVQVLSNQTASVELYKLTIN